jgi:hypothetical protein
MNNANVQAYFKVVTRTASDATQIIEKLQIDANTYANTAATTNTYTLNDGKTVTQTVTKTFQTYYDYEIEENEKKRTIKLLKPEFIPFVEKEFKRVIRG